MLPGPSNVAGQHQIQEVSLRALTLATADEVGGGAATRTRPRPSAGTVTVTVRDSQAGTVTVFQVGHWWPAGVWLGPADGPPAAGPDEGAIVTIRLGVRDSGRGSG